MKGHRLKCQDGFAGAVHRFNLFLEPSRGADRAQLAVGVYQDWDSVGVCGCNPTNVADKAAVAHVRTWGADSNNVIGPEDAVAGAIAQGRVVAAGGVATERTNTGGRVEVAYGVVMERTNTVGRVVFAAGVAKERLITVGHVKPAGGVAIERSKTSGRVEFAFGIVIERRITVGSVVVADCVVRQRISASGTIEKPAGVAKER